MRTTAALSVVTAAALVFAVAAEAQQSRPSAPRAPTPYGMPISLELAKKAAAAAEAEAAKSGFPSGIAIVGPNGEVIFEEKMDNSNNSAVMAAEQKARGAALYRRPSMFFQQRMVQAPYVTQLAGVSVLGGGIPLVREGRIIGAIGLSGAPSSEKDAEAAQAGADAVK